jgi:hypothetical protein
LRQGKIKPTEKIASPDGSPAEAPLLGSLAAMLGSTKVDFQRIYNQRADLASALGTASPSNMLGDQTEPTLRAWRYGQTQAERLSPLCCM